jgi:hypothetical protein
MTLIIIIVVLVLIFGGGGFYGHRQGYYGGRGHSLIWIVFRSRDKAATGRQRNDRHPTKAVGR